LASSRFIICARTPGTAAHFSIKSGFRAIRDEIRSHLQKFVRRS
jgi:hypothetical protein